MSLSVESFIKVVVLRNDDVCSCIVEVNEIIILFSNALMGTFGNHEKGMRPWVLFVQANISHGYTPFFCCLIY